MYAITLAICLLLLVLPNISSQNPVDTPSSAELAAALASTSNIYLLGCTSRGRRGRESQSANALAYFNRPVPENESNPQPDQSAIIVATPEAPWEGVTWQFRAWNNKDFLSEIDSGAEKLAKGQIAGKVKMGSENFVCFRDGATAVELNTGGRRRDRWECVAGYWCASIDVGK